jgi:hypothetical protein
VPKEVGVACVRVGDAFPSPVDFAFSSTGTTILSTFSGAAPKFDWLHRRIKFSFKIRQEMPNAASKDSAVHEMVPQRTLLDRMVGVRSQ